MDDDKKLPIPVAGGRNDECGHMLAANTPNCPKCGNPPSTFYVANHDLIWHEGDVMCPCGHRVRTYDAG
jgi:hypothetical protein